MGLTVTYYLKIIYKYEIFFLTHWPPFGTCWVPPRSAYLNTLEGYLLVKISKPTYYYFW